MRREALRARQNELIARSSAHRDEIARSLDAWRKPLERVDRAIEIAGRLRRHAPWIVAALGAMLAFRPAPVRWLPRAGTAWRVAKGVIGLVSSLR